MAEQKRLVNLRVTERQLDRLRKDARAAGMNVSEWVRHRMLGEEPGQGRQRVRTTRRRNQLERARAARESLPAREGGANPTEPSRAERPSVPEPMPNALQLAGRARVSVSRASEWLARGLVERRDGDIYVEGRRL